jgi:two-component system CheB/CheR fusion protein
MTPDPQLSVLIVEDNPDAADSLAELLAARGHTTRVARTGAEALEAAAAGHFDAVVIDIILPDAEGYTVASRLRRAMAGRPLVVAVTGWPNLDGWSRENGIDHHLVKPVEPAALCDLLDGHAGRAARG